MLLTKVRDYMLEHRITVGACAGSFPFPKKDGKGNVIRPMNLDFTDLDKALVFHEDFPQMSWYFSFDQGSNQPTGDLFGSAPWMSDEFKSIFGEWLTNCVERVNVKTREMVEALGG